MTKDEETICDLLDGFTRALYNKDAAGAIASFAGDAVAFDLAPPLKQDSDVMHDPARLEEWFATWKSPIVSESERTIVVDRDVAYAYGLQRMTGTKTDGTEVELFFRATASRPACRLSRDPRSHIGQEYQSSRLHGSPPSLD